MSKKIFKTFLCGLSTLLVTSCTANLDNFVYHYEVNFSTIDTSNIEVEKLIVGIIGLILMIMIIMLLFLMLEVVMLMDMMFK